MGIYQERKRKKMLRLFFKKLFVVVNNCTFYPLTSLSLNMTFRAKGSHRVLELGKSPTCHLSQKGKKRLRTLRFHLRQNPRCYFAFFVLQFLSILYQAAFCPGKLTSTNCVHKLSCSQAFGWFLSTKKNHYQEMLRRKTMTNLLLLSHFSHVRLCVTP